jgi:hypothetical protein
MSPLSYSVRFLIGFYYKTTGLWRNSLARPQQRQTRALMLLPSILKHGSPGRRTRAQHQQPANSQDSLPPNWKPLDSKTKSPHCFTPLELYFTRKRSFPHELDVPYRTLWGWINESEENRQRYDKARIEQYEMIRMRIDKVINSMRQGDIQMVSEDFKVWLDSLQNQDQTGKLEEQDDPYWELKSRMGIV